MAYSTIAKVRVASGLSSSALVADAIITEKLGYADSLIDAAVGAAYALPLSDATCGLIVHLSTEITAAILMLEQYSEEAADTDKGWQKRLDFLMKQLEMIRIGKLRLYTSAGVELTRAATDVPAHYPTVASSEPDATDTTEAKLTMNQTF